MTPRRRRGLGQFAQTWNATKELREIFADLPSDHRRLLLSYGRNLVRLQEAQDRQARQTHDDERGK